MTDAIATVPYYADKTAVLRRLFGRDVEVAADALIVGDSRYPVVDDVIVALDPSKWPASLRARLERDEVGGGSTPYAEDIQHTFGAEWTTFDTVLPEHRQEFEQYFDLIDRSALSGSVVADLGCGAGRYATFVAPHAGALIAVDFSEAIFVSRRNLAGTDAVFVMADLLDLPFAENAFDFAYSLGVLHHLPVDALQALRGLRSLAPRFLIYLYYALDNRPAYYRTLLSGVTAVRRVLAGIRSERARSVLTSVIAAFVYVPLAVVGRALHPIGLDRRVPLADFYRGKSWQRLRQDAYDRFFTRIEQRFSRADLEALADAEWQVEVSDGLPYWHFTYERR